MVAIRFRFMSPLKENLVIEEWPDNDNWLCVECGKGGSVSAGSGMRFFVEHQCRLITESVTSRSISNTHKHSNN